MPDRDVHTVRDVIYFQYSKIIAKAAFKLSDGREAKKSAYGFIKNTFRELQSGKIVWSEITREDWQFVGSEKNCIYCGSSENMHKEHIVPKSIKINERCSECERILQIHNQIWACADCNHKKGTLGLYRFYKSRMPEEKKFFDFLPPLLEKKYLKTMYFCHQCAGTLDSTDLDGDNSMTVLDIDWIIKR
jgi:hypothetical protein